MLYTTFKVGETEYKCRLTTKSMIDLEKKLGCNPLSIFMKRENNLPTLDELLLVLHASLQAYNHGITLEKVYDIYDSYVDQGGTFIDFIPVIMEIYKVSGLFQESESPKN